MLILIPPDLILNDQANLRMKIRNILIISVLPLFFMQCDRKGSNESASLKILYDSLSFIKLTISQKGIGSALSNLPSLISLAIVCIEIKC